MGKKKRAGRNRYELREEDPALLLGDAFLPTAPLSYTRPPV
jgi:hypothetical protein